ncbi:MAG: DUF2281 domain-containing protein [Chloroflexi bacterium]|nr:DUF2281 domain-containing protein [Chloroflexota bacterium]
MTLQPTVYEQKLIRIVRRLPPERVTQVIDFAQFLESKLDEEESEEEIAADNARWDALLATDEAQRLLEKMADEALADMRAGRARPMIFTEDGEIAPG